MILDECLTFNKHVDYLYRKSSSRLGAVRRERKFLDVNMSLSLYKSLVVPHFDYSGKEIILGRERESSVVELHRDLSILPLESRVFIHMGNECHKSVYSDGMYSLAQFFVPLTDVRARKMRASTANRLRIPKAKTNAGHKAIRVRGPVFWNTLDDTLATIQDGKAFNHAISTTMSQANILGNQNFPT